MSTANAGPLLPLVGAEQATGVVAQVYRNTEREWGFVPGGFQLVANSPDLLAGMAGILGYFVAKSDIPRELMAWMRLLVSDRTGCRYCVDFNHALLLQMGTSQDQIDAARQDPAEVPLPAEQKVLLGYVLRACSDPHSVGAADLEAVRAAGWSDRVIFDAVFHGALNQAADTVYDTFKYTG